MSSRRPSPSMHTSDSARTRTSDAAQVPTPILRVALAGLLGIAVALLVSACASSSDKLIPLADAGPLQSDFEAVAQAAEAGDGNCSATKAAIDTTEQDFSALPATVDAGLRDTLRQGIDNLRSHALALCAQPLVQSTATTTTAKITTTHTTATAPTETQTTNTQTTSTTSPPTTSSPGGGTPAPGVGETPAGSGEPGGGTGAGASSPQGESGSPANGSGAAASSPQGENGAAGGAGAGGGQEGAK
jgi:hypothetical protein